MTRRAFAPLELLALTVICVVGPAQAQRSASTVRVRTISGIAERVIYPPSPCRGGAAITREEIAERNAQIQRVVLGSAKFTAFAGSRRGRLAAKFATDRAGKFSLRLPAGQYCIVVGHVGEIKPNKNEPLAPVSAATDPNLDPECMRESAFVCDATLFVQDTNTSNVKLELAAFTRCAAQWAHPCWRGPMPP